MAGSTFQTNPYDLDKLLEDCHRGTIQLPDFQRSWVWDEERIKSLIASISRAFPVGALMSLNTGGPVNFKPRPIEGAPVEARAVTPQSLLLDGQQRMTSLYQVTLRNRVVETVTPKNKKVKRWFYIDIQKALDPSIDREEAILGVPEDRVIHSNFGRGVILDLSSPDKEYASLMYPVSRVFDWDKWQDYFDQHWRGDANESVREEFRTFKRQVLENFKYYRVPVIALDRSTSKEAVCVATGAADHQHPIQTALFLFAAQESVKQHASLGARGLGGTGRAKSCSEGRGVLPILFPAARDGRLRPFSALAGFGPAFMRIYAGFGTTMHRAVAGASGAST